MSGEQASDAHRTGPESVALWSLSHHLSTAWQVIWPKIGMLVAGLSLLQSVFTLTAAFVLILTCLDGVI